MNSPKGHTILHFLKPMCSVVVLLLKQHTMESMILMSNLMMQENSIIN